MKNPELFDKYKDIFTTVDNSTGFTTRDIKPNTVATLGDIVDALTYVISYIDKTNGSPTVSTPLPQPPQITPKSVAPQEVTPNVVPTPQPKPVPAAPAVKKSTWTNMVDEKNGVYICRIDPDKLNILMWNKPFVNIPTKNAINGSFFWGGRPNAVLINDYKTITSNPSHAFRGYPQSVIYYDGKKLNAKVMKAGEASLLKPKWAIGGVGIMLPNGQITSPDKEGFNGAYADVLRQTYKTTLAANIAKNEVYAIVHTHMISYQGLIAYYSRIGQVVKDLVLDIAIGLDGGGSTNLKLGNQMAYKNASPRSINHLITW